MQRYDHGESPHRKYKGSEFYLLPPSIFPHDPIDTIEVSDETLPPRKKRGKVAWRLPTDDSRLVCHNIMSRFPMDLFLSCSWLLICASLLDMLLDVVCFHLLSDAILVCNMNYI